MDRTNHGTRRLQSFRSLTLAISVFWLSIATFVPRTASAQIPVVPPVTPPVASTLPAPWLGQDLGGPAVGGSSVFSNARFVIAAGGEDIAGVSDQFRFVYQRLAGNVEIKARLESLTPTQNSTAAGLMIRSSLEPNAAHGAVLLSASGELAFRRRYQDGASTTASSGDTLSAAPRWMALQRIGARVVAYSSPDGETWTAIGSEAIELGSTVYVGMAVTSHDITQGTTAEISHVSVAGLPPWQHQDNIGGPVMQGSAWQTQGTYTITGGGAIGDQQDQFNFVYQTMRGDLDIVARVASLSGINRSAKAGVMIRESLSAGSRHAFALVSAGNGYARHAKEETVRMRLSEGLTGLVGESMQPLVVEDATRHPRFKYFREAGEDPYHSFLGVPLVDRGLLQGALVVQTIESRTYDQGEVRMLATAGAQLGSIVSEARALGQFVAPAHQRLGALAQNLWWCWDADTTRLFRELDPELWRQVGHNPVALLQLIAIDKVEERAKELVLHTWPHTLMECLSV